MAFGSRAMTMSDDPISPTKRTVGRDGKSYPSRRGPKPQPGAVNTTANSAGKTVPKQLTPWKPGQSGNPGGRPQGSRNKATLLAEALIDAKGKELVDKCVEMALAGDQSSMRVIMDRLVPPRKERPIDFRLPPVKTAADLPAAASAVAEAVASGELFPSEASSLGTLLSSIAKSIETAQLAERLDKLEELLAKGANP
jgi:hypothetical protein